MIAFIGVYEVFNGIESIALLLFVVFMFFKKNKTFGKSIRMITSIILFNINVFKFPIEKQLGQSYNLTMILIILWYINAVFATYEISKGN